MEDHMIQLTELDKEMTEKKKLKNLCIVIPTYNEADNITKLLDKIFVNELMQKGNDRLNFKVLVVDDDSPDGTGRKVKDYGRKNTKVHLLTRKKKEGLGAAYIAGMQYAMKKLNPDVIMEMDADFSHNPDDILRLVDELRRGADFVIGSRYVDGGSIPEDWGAHRKFISKCANVATRTILGVKDVRDCSGGFRAIRASLLERVRLESLNTKGYAFQAALLEAAVFHGAVVREVPIRFSDREEGESKMRLYDALEGFTSLAGIRAKRMFSESEYIQAGQRAETV